MNKLPKIEQLITSTNFRTRIGMYLGEKNINTLKGFLDGIQYALDVYDLGTKREFFLEGFHDYVARYYGWHESTAGWKNILLKECNDDPVLSVDEFFKLYDFFSIEKMEK
jgi:hypothetical protein